MPDFDLEQEIQRWRQSLAASLADRAGGDDILDELESHLREDVDRRTRAGTPPAAAFGAAVARLGPAEPLAAEFGKVSSPAGAATRATWLPARLVLFAQAATAVGLALFSFSFVRDRGPSRDLLLGVHIFAVSTGYTAALAVGALSAWAILTRAAGGFHARRAAAFRSAALTLTVTGLALTVPGVCWGRYGQTRT